MKDAANYYQSLPKKRMAASAICFNEQGNLLIVKPTYRDYWLLPGGCVEEDESPREACLRELKEELNISVTLERLVGIDYLSRENEETECMQFAFYGEVLSQAQIKAITLPTSELSEYCFSPLQEVFLILSPKLAKGLPYYLQALHKNTIVYLEDGREIR